MSTKINSKREDSAEPSFATAPITPRQPRIKLVPDSASGPKFTRPAHLSGPTQEPSGPEGDP